MPTVREYAKFHGLLNNTMRAICDFNTPGIKLDEPVPSRVVQVMNNHSGAQSLLHDLRSRDEDFVRKIKGGLAPSSVPQKPNISSVTALVRHQTTNSQQGRSAVMFDYESLRGLDDVTTEQTAQKWWNSSAEIRAEFGDKDRFTAYCKAMSNNQVKILKGSVVGV